MGEYHDVWRRVPQDTAASPLPTSIAAPTNVGTTVSFEGLSTATAPAPSTTLTSIPTTSTHVSSSTSAPTAAATSSSPAKASTNHMSSLIPAIVAPVVVVLVISFGLFWWFMRRSAQRGRKDEPEFAMEHRSEKSHNRKGSAHSQSSTRNLVSRGDMTPMKKEPVTKVTEVTRPSLDPIPMSKRQSSGIGFDVSKFPIPGSDHSRQTSNASHDPSGPPMVPPVAVRNFSRGPSRPNTGGRESDSSAGSFLQPRNLSSPIPRPLNVANGAQKKMPIKTGLSQSNTSGPWVPPKNPYRRPGTGDGSSPPRSGTSTPDRRPAPAPPMFKDKASRQQPQQRKGGLRGPGMQNDGPQSARPSTDTLRSGPQAPINNSRQTPDKVIDKKPARKSPPTAIKTGNSPPSQSAADFSEENMRIARLADSSRLGFYPTTGATKPPTTVATIQESSNTVEPPKPSPRLPPPATRDAPPSTMNIPIPPPPAEPVMPSPNSRRVDSFAPDRKSVRSMVSRLSSDGGYIDMEIDDKSDVSSLDERERWQVEQHARSESRSGFGGYGAVGPARHQAPLVRRAGTESEASGSMYSLGRY